jgi:hypothetical protein
MDIQPSNQNIREMPPIGHTTDQKPMVKRSNGPIFLMFCGLIAVLVWSGFTAYGRYLAPLGKMPTDFRMAAIIFGFPGAVAVALLWFQVMVGSNLRLLRPRVSGIDLWHRTNGLFVLLFALIHPILLIVGLTPAVYLKFEFVPKGLFPAVIAADLALLMLIAAVATALMMRRAWFIRRWHTVHYLNYAAFVLIWLHGWYLGVATTNPAAKALWVFYGATVAVSAAFRLWREASARQ